MKIKGVETICLSRVHEPSRQWFTARGRTVKADCVIVTIHTDEGLVGYGEACPYGGPIQIKQWVEWLSKELVNRDPTRLETIFFHPNGRRVSTEFPFLSPYDCAVAAIDTALWDLRGKAVNRPVASLLNEHAKVNQIRLYASAGCRYDWRVNPHQVIEEALSCLAEGYTAYKLRLGSEWSWDGVTTDQFLGLMSELAATIKGRMELIVDGNHRLNIDQAMIIARGLGRLGFSWFEEPLLLENIEGYVQLNSKGDIPISGGEQFTTLEQFIPYLERKALSIIQPDVACCGLTEAMQIALMASHYKVDVCPHNWHNGLMTMANAHYVAALPSPKMLELCMIQGPLQWEILTKKPAIVNGYLSLPQAAGLGVNIADGLDQIFPFIEGHYAVEVVR